MGDFKGWHEGVVGEIEQQKIRLSPKGQKKYNVKLLTRAAKRVAEFSDECETCRGLQGEINELVSRLGNADQFSREERKEFRKKQKSLTEHLQKQHKLVPEGYYIAIGAGLGISIGVAIGTALGNIGAGIGVGIALGVGIGAGLDAQAKKEGKVI
jgi:hypothetical protein